MKQEDQKKRSDDSSSNNGTNLTNGDRHLRNGLVKGTDGKYKRGQLSYKEPDHTLVSGYGMPVSLEIAKELIGNYWHESKQNAANNENEDIPLAFTFGKESLLSILSQKSCEGVRFYLAKKKVDQPGIPDWQAGLTLVAIGVKPEVKDNGVIGDDPEIGAGSDHIFDDLKMEGSVGINEDSDGLIYETVPPYPGEGGVEGNNKFTGKLLKAFVSFKK